jgi:hypothetical protein
MLHQVIQLMPNPFYALLTAFSGAFGGLFAYGIQTMGKRCGLSGKSHLQPKST